MSSNFSKKDDKNEKNRQNFRCKQRRRPPRQTGSRAVNASRIDGRFCSRSRLCWAAGATSHAAQKTTSAAIARWQDLKGGVSSIAHVHLWKLPPAMRRPMNDDATFSHGFAAARCPGWKWTACPADYDARVGGPKVDKVVLIESSVGVTGPTKSFSRISGCWRRAANDGKILSVGRQFWMWTLAPATFRAAGDPVGPPTKKWVGIRIGGRGIFFRRICPAVVCQYPAECDDQSGSDG